MAISPDSVYESPLNNPNTVNQAVKGYDHKIQILSKKLQGLAEGSDERAKVIDELQKTTQAKQVLGRYKSSSSQPRLSTAKEHSSIHETWMHINTLVRQKIAPKTELNKLKILNAGLNFRLTTLEEELKLKTAIKRITDPEVLTQALEKAAKNGKLELVEYIIKKHPDTIVRDAAKFAKRAGHEEIWNLLVPLKKYQVMQRRLEEDPTDLDALEYILLFDMHRAEANSPEDKQLKEVQEWINAGVPPQREAINAYMKAFETDNTKVMQMLGPQLEFIHYTTGDALNSWDRIKESLISAIKETTSKNPDLLGNVLANVQDALLEHFRELHPKDAMKLLLEVVQPKSLGALIFYNTMVPQEPSSLDITYNDDTPLQEVKQLVEKLHPDKTVVLLRKDIYSDVWLPIDLSEEQMDVWEVDKLGIGIIDKEGKGIVHIMPTSSMPLPPSSMQEVD